MAAFDNTGGLVNVHCLIMEVLLEFGLSALLPLLVLVFMIFKMLCVRLYTAAKTHRWVQVSYILFLLFTTLAYVFLSTANFSSWRISAMWLYTAMMILFGGKMKHGDRNEYADKYSFTHK